jgi:hypothetical protein
MFMGTVRTDLRTSGNICTLALILTLIQKCVSNNDIDSFDGGPTLQDEILDEVKIMVPNWMNFHFCLHQIESGVLCTFGCNLYLQVYFVLSFLEVQSTAKGTLTHRNQYFSTGNGKRVHSTSKSTFMYFQMHYELSIVLCTFKCMLKSTRCMLKHCRKLQFNFLKKSMNTKIGIDKIV